MTDFNQQNSDQGSSAARIPERDEHQSRIDHATWVVRRKRNGRCICLGCWNHYDRYREDFGRAR